MAVKLNCAAIVVGINDYLHNRKLKNAVADAEAMADEFRKLKYDVHLLKNATKDQFDDELDIVTSGSFDVVVIYFAGHGMIYMKSDYIVFSDAQEMRMHEGTPATRKSREISSLYKEIRSQLPNSIVIAIIDACRKDMGDEVEYGGDVERGGVTPTVEGLTKLPYQTFIAFATSPDDTTGDGKGNHSLYTYALLEELGVYNQPIETTFKKVRKKIYKGYDSHLPWEHSCLVDEFCFNHGQLFAHYGSVYFPDGYNYGLRDDRVVKCNDLATTLLSNLNSPRFADICNSIKELRCTDQFIIGRMIMGRVLMNIDDNNLVLSSRFIDNFNVDNGNHILNGMIYELYFLNSDQERKWISNPDIYQNIYSLVNSGKYDDTIKFVNDDILPILGNEHYLPGRNVFAKFNVSMNLNEYATDTGDMVYSLESLRYKNQNFDIFAEAGINAMSYAVMRSIMMRHAKSPSMLLSVDAFTGGNSLSPTDLIINGEISDVDISDLLMNYFISGIDSSFDELGHHYELGEIEDLYVDRVSLEDNDITVKGEVWVSAVIYYDNEEDVKTDVSLRGDFCIQNYLDRDRSEISVHLDTSDYYK